MNDPKPLVPVNPEGLTELMNELLAPIATPPSAPSPKNGIILAPSFITDPENYVGIPQYNLVISKRERHKNLKWEPTLKAIHEEGKSLGGELYMPNISEFMTHFFDVKEAALGKGVLYDGRGKPIKKDEATSQWNYFSSTNRSGFNGQVCWTWLNTKFVKGKGALKLTLQKDYRFDVKGSLKFTEMPLEACLEEDTFVDLNKPFNKQYLVTPSQKSANTNYAQAHNIYFRYPRRNTVAGFWADSGGAYLFCYGNPSDSRESLGVFVCAEGASPENRRTP